MLIVAVGVLAGARGQEGVMRVGSESQDVDRDMLLNAHYLGTVEGQDLWLTRSEAGVKGLAQKRDWHVVRLTEGLLPMERLELRGTSNCQVLGVVGARSDERARHVSALLVDSSARGRVTILRARIGVEMTRMDAGVDTMDLYTYDYRDISKVWGALSPNGKYLGVLTIVQYVEQGEYLSIAKMFDENLNLVWEKDFGVGATEGIYVDDAGRMFTLGVERAKDGVRFVMSEMDKEGADTYGMNMDCDPVHDVKIVNVQGDNVLCAGLFTASMADPEDLPTTGVVTLMFNVKTVQMSGFSMRIFQNEDVNVMKNKNTKKIQLDHEVPMVSVLGSVEMPWGAVVAVGHRHMVHRSNPNGTTEDWWYGRGIHLVALDNSGKMRWVRNIRRNDRTDIGGGMLKTHLFAEGGKVCLLKNEDRREPEEYTVTEEAREYEVGESSNLVLYTVSERGEVKKRIMERETKHALANMCRKKDGSLLLLTAKGNKCRRAEMKMR